MLSGLCYIGIYIIMCLIFHDRMNSKEQFLCFIGMWWIYNIVLVADVQRSDLVITYITKCHSKYSYPRCIPRYYNVIAYILYVVLPLL